MAYSVTLAAEEADLLDSLGTALTADGMHVMLGAAAGGIPTLRVVNPVARELAECILVRRADDGTWWYWWSWAERLAPAADPAAAAARIRRVLAAVGE